MTDWIAVLLEEQWKAQAEEKPWQPQWKQGYLAVGDGQEGATAADLPDGEASGCAERNTDTAQMARTQWEETAVEEFAARRFLTDAFFRQNPVGAVMEQTAGPLWQTRFVQAAEMGRMGQAPGAALLWRKLLQGDAALSRSAPVQRAEQSEQIPMGTPLDVGALDRVVERDARRYDGGFCLY